MGQSGHYLKPNIFYELTDAETVINNSLEVDTSHFRYLQVMARRSKPSSRRLYSLHVYTGKISNFCSPKD